MDTQPPRHLDYSEFTDAEIDEWEPRVQKSINEDYIAYVKELLAARTFPTTDAGWEALKDQAAADAVATNLLARTVSSISAQRRTERLLTSGDIATTPLTREMTPADVEAMLRAAQPDGELRTMDGMLMSQQEVEEAADAMNNAMARQQMLSSYRPGPDEVRSVGEIAYRARFNSGRPVRQPARHGGAHRAH